MLSRRHFNLAALAAAALPAHLRAQAVSPRPLRIVASFSILGDWVRQVAPPGTEVSTLVGAEVDAHGYSPSPADVKRVARADLVVVNGLGFEGWLDRLVKASGYRGPVVVTSAGLTARKVGGGADPHVWQDLALARRCVDNLRDAVAQARPDQAPLVRERAAAYSARLGALDAQVRARLATVPAGQRRVVSSHDAFGYFSAAYGVEFVSPRGWSTEREPSAAAVARLITLIRQQQLRAVFIENITDTQLMTRIAAESGARVGGRLYADALSAPGGPADSYLRLFAHNAWAMADALGAAPAPRPDL